MSSLHFPTFYKLVWLWRCVPACQFYHNLPSCEMSYFCFLIWIELLITSQSVLETQQKQLSKQGTFSCMLTLMPLCHGMHNIVIYSLYFISLKQFFLIEKITVGDKPRQRPNPVVPPSKPLAHMIGLIFLPLLHFHTSDTLFLILSADLL